MIETSRMSGTSSIVVRPGASRAAAMSLSALFLAPVTRTRPDRAVPPVTSKHSTRPPYGGEQPGPARYRQPPRTPRLPLMTVRLTRIYTKTGDAGQTHLGDMSRVAKTDPRLVAYADVDEANSVLGTALALGAPDPAVADLLRSIQNDLFDVGADLCTPITPDPKYPPLRVTPPTPSGSRRRATSTTRRCRSSTASSSPAAPRPPRCCTRRGWSPGGPSAACGRCWRCDGGARPTPRPPATSTGSRTCCSSCRGSRTPAATSCGSPGRTAARTPSGARDG